MNFVESLFDMSKSITQSLCDKELLSEPEPPSSTRGALGYFIHGGALNNFQAEICLWQGTLFSPCQLKGFVLDVTLQSACN